MNELKTISLLNRLSNVQFKKTKNLHCSYDAEDDGHLAEIKNRRSYYSTKMIEASKMFVNFQKAQLKGKSFIYVVTDSKGLYVFNITRLIDTIIQRDIIKKELPSKTDFEGGKEITKYYYTLEEEMSSLTFVFD